VSTPFKYAYGSRPLSRADWIKAKGFHPAFDDMGRKLTFSNVRFWPILLKKSAMVSTVEKYALEIEVFTLSRGFRAQISCSGAPERRSQQSVCGQSGRTDFFNRIGR
jgi:hypothetical protein